ncbi:MAG: VOC family protein [Pseudomonadota bacterium]|nr:VOC family protein [Pseudomonadota bacterium]
MKRSVMSITNVLASVAVKDLNAAVKWYEKLLDASASKPMPEVAEWKFERGGWLQVYELADRAGSGSFTLVVNDMDQQISRLKKLGVDINQQTSGEKVRTLMITDPDGNHIAFAEPNDSSLAQ